MIFKLQINFYAYAEQNILKLKIIPLIIICIFNLELKIYFVRIILFYYYFYTFNRYYMYFIDKIFCAIQSII